MNFKDYRSFKHAACCNVICAEFGKGHISAEGALTQLANQNGRLLARLMELEQIAPKKITTKDGVYIWHCPDELIPESP